MGRRKPDMQFLHSVARRAYREEANSLADREVAYVQKARELGADTEQAFSMLEIQRGRNSRSTGRKAVGAYPTSSAVVSDGDGGCKLQHKSGPTCKVKEYKSRRNLRAAVACRQATHTVEQSRFYQHITAPYRKGGSMPARVRKQVRRILCKADHLYSQGEIQAAIAIFRGEL